MKKLIHLKSFQEFDPVQWEQEGQPVQEADRVSAAFANATGNVFDQDEDKWGRTSKTDKWEDNKKDKKPKDKKPKTPGRIGMAYKDAKNQLWKGYKSELHPGFQKLRKYLKGRESYLD